MLAEYLFCPNEMNANANVWMCEANANVWAVSVWGNALGSNIDSEKMPISIPHWP